jgi:hypothetical protein
MLQIQVGKTEFYQGELVPVTATLFVHRQTGLRRMGLIEVAKDDFAIQRFPQNSEQSFEMVGEQPYLVMTFRSTLSALKTGKLDVGPARMEVLLDVPDLSGGPPSIFGQMFGEPRKLTVSSQKVSVTVLPLPAEGKPPGFSGAVGDFQMAASASPNNLAVGDPVTVEIAVSGSGNFDALTAPALSDPTGWKTYPSRRYVMDGMADPNLATSVERRIGFTQVVVPEKQQSAVPPFERSFFSPSQRQYVTLRTQAIPIVVTPAPAAAGGEIGVGGGTGAGGIAIAPPVEANITDILQRMPARPTPLGAPSVPLVRQPVFWIVNSLPVAGLIGAFALAAMRRRREEESRSPEAALRVLWQEMNERGLSEADFLRRAALFIHATGSGRTLDPAVKAVLARYEEASFSGAGRAPVMPLSNAERAEVLSVLAPLLSSPGAPAATPPPVPRTAFSALAAGAFFLGALGISHAASADPRYAEMLGALEKKDFSAASRAGESMIGDGQLSPEVFELMGHARYRQDDPGRAALWYRRAELFDPLNPELRQNLRHLREKYQAITYPAPSFPRRLALGLPADRWALLASAGGWLALCSAAFWVLARGARWRGWIITSGIAGALVLAVSLAGAMIRPDAASRVRDRQVITMPKLQVRTSASSTSGSVIELPAGSEVRLLERRGAWSYIEIPGSPDSLRGWIETEGMAALWPWDERLVN